MSRVSDLLAKLPLSQSQLENMANQRAIKKLGVAFYSLSIAEREACRKNEMQLIKQERNAVGVGVGINGDNKNAQTKTNNQITVGTNPPQQKKDSLAALRDKIQTEFRAASDKANNQTIQSSTVSGSLDAITIPEEIQIQPSEQFQARTAKAESLAPTPASIQSKPFEAMGDKSGDATEGKSKTFALDIVLNANQMMGADMAENGKCFVFTGPAGTGKTTGCREIAKRLLEKGKLNQHDFKLPGGERVMAPSIAFVAYTNRATDNMRRALHKDPALEEALAYNVITVHKLLEYEPVFPEVYDEKTKEYRTTMRFEPQRHSGNPLKITHLVIEEASMLGIDLWMKLLDALQPGCQIIFVGDINQLPPVFGKSILNYALVTLPVVELTEVYRQALDSPIIANAHRCLKGEPLVEARPFFQVVSGSKIKTIPTESGVVNQLVRSLESWSKTLEDEKVSKTQMKYDPIQDIILCPQGKEGQLKGSANATVINSHIAGFLGKQREALVYEIFAGMVKRYLAVGDRVMIDKQDGVIVKIVHNGRYLGKMPRPANTAMTRFGIQLADKAAEHEDLELSLSGYAALNIEDIPNEKEQKKQEASHIVDVLLDTGQTVTLNSIGDFADNTFQLGYALTVHKAQGCEWRKVFIVLHKNHAMMLNRELLYTAITRAREYCIIVDLCNQVDVAIANQRIKGNTVQEKIEWFNSEVSLNEPVPVIP